jgi:hypothetical protein
MPDPLPAANTEGQPEPRISAGQAVLVAIGSLVVGGVVLVMIAAVPDGWSFSSMLWPVILGTAVGVVEGVAVYLWSANQYRQGRVRSAKVLPITGGSVLAMAGAATAIRQGPIALQAGFIIACAVWFATIMSLVAA